MSQRLTSRVHDRVLDLGAGDAPDPRSTETVDLYADADHEFDLDESWPVDDASVKGIIASHVVEHLAEPRDFFAEAGRVLVDGGWLEMTVPVGADAIADPDHETRWGWRTPEIYCRDRSAENGRPWDPDPPFTLLDRDADVWFFAPFRPLTPLLQAMSKRCPAEAVRRCSSGEITARYRRIER